MYANVLIKIHQYQFNQFECCELCEQIRLGLDFAEVACRSFPCQYINVISSYILRFHRNSGHAAIYACAGQSRDFMFDRGLARHLHQGLDAMPSAARAESGIFNAGRNGKTDA